MTEILKTIALSKSYGKVTAVDNLSLEVKQGEVYGILGPNGSGKTTTLGMILDVVKPDSGSYQWFGEPPASQVRQRIGAILESPSFYPYMTAVQNLDIVAAIKKCDHGRIEQVLETVGLHGRKDDAFKTYSLGMKQRLSIAAALLADPPVLILDEPTNGLDPQGIAEVRQLIKEVSTNGKTIIIASHLLDEVQRVCSTFMVLKKGQKVYEGTVEDALGPTNSLRLRAENIELLKTSMNDISQLKMMESEDDAIIAHFEGHVSPADINGVMMERGVVLSHLEVVRGSLEQKFLKILSEDD